MRPAPQGRAYREQRHYCHITIQVTSEEQPKDQKTLRAEAAKAKKAEGKKAEGGAKKVKAPAKKKASPKQTKKAKEEPAEDIVEQSPAEISAQADANIEAEAANAKNVASQTPAERHETKPADEKQQDINEELERQ
jgi:hypothetical protein